jgi:hypothetical protein
MLKKSDDAARRSVRDIFPETRSAARPRRKFSDRPPANRGLVGVHRDSPRSIVGTACSLAMAGVSGDCRLSRNPCIAGLTVVDASSAMASNSDEHQSDV